MEGDSGVSVGLVGAGVQQTGCSWSEIKCKKLEVGVQLKLAVVLFRVWVWGCGRGWCGSEAGLVEERVPEVGAGVGRRC